MTVLKNDGTPRGATVTSEMKKRKYDEGYEARKAGLPYHASPYSRGWSAGEWRRGWRDAHKLLNDGKFVNYEPRTSIPRKPPAPKEHRRGEAAKAGRNYKGGKLDDAEAEL